MRISDWSSDVCSSDLVVRRTRVGVFVVAQIAYVFVFDCVVAKLANVFEHASQCAEHAEREYIDFQQAERFEIILVPLDDRAIWHRRILDRHQFMQWSVGDHEAADVLRQMSRGAAFDQSAREIKPAANARHVRIDTDTAQALGEPLRIRSEEHTSELQSLMRISYAVF